MPEVCPSSWQEAQRVSMSSGVAVDGDRVVLHNDLFGMQQLFFSEHRAESISATGCRCSLPPPRP
jgi:hypothetical protein